MLPKDYYAIVHGYNNKQRKKADLLRLSVWAALSSWEGEINFHTWSKRFFPLWFDEIENVQPVELTEEETESLIKRHNLKHSKKAN